MSLDDLDPLYFVRFLLELRGISQIWEPTAAKRKETDPVLSATELYSGNSYNFWMKRIPRKPEGWDIVWRKLRNANYNRSWLIHPCDGQTYRTGDCIKHAKKQICVQCARRNLSSERSANYKLPFLNCRMYCSSYCLANVLHRVGDVIVMLLLHCWVGQKTGSLCFTAYNFRNIQQIFTKFGTNHSHFILNIMP